MIFYKKLLGWTIVVITFCLFYGFIADRKLSAFQAVLMTVISYLIMASMFIIPYDLIFGG